MRQLKTFTTCDCCRQNDYKHEIKFAQQFRNWRTGQVVDICEGCTEYGVSFCKPCCQLVDEGNPCKCKQSEKAA